ncbi:UDP-glucuronosyl and UDP-glucosyl transferase [Phaffia rhodozyma]|uniref:sterol 3beta-glucosyltransferase n=1 Tax=Phaffia rhodozyma TaxID=264483 RepID=A0A0F7SRU7_PHARH|nr:UDP-glucuronosyl and UDP-glucosyl transferase [Phaffia rhodozyma]
MSSSGTSFNDGKDLRSSPETISPVADSGNDSDASAEQGQPPIRFQAISPPESKQYLPMYKSALPPMFHMISQIAQSNDMKDQPSHTSVSSMDFSDIESEVQSPVAGGDDDWVSPSPSLDSQDLAARLAQLSVSNFVGSSGPETVDEYSGAGENGSNESSTRMSDQKSTSEEDELTDEEKMDAIVDVFGEYVKPGEEKFVSETKGGFFRGVVILGNFYLTTHRLTFNAIIPSPKLLERIQGSNSSRDSASMIIKAGPVTVHRNSPYKKKKKVWLELGHDTCSVYPDASEEGRTRPFYTVLLSSCKQILPDDPEDPLSIRIVYTSPRRGVLETRRFTFDTREATLSWRREFEGAFFHIERMRLIQRKSTSQKEDSESSAESAGFGKKEDWDRIKISIPLERIVKHETSNYMAFASLLILSVDNRPSADYLSDSTSPSSIPTAGRESLVKIQFTCLASHMFFIEAFQNSLELAQQRTDAQGKISARPMLDFSGSSKHFMKKSIGLSESDEDKEEDEDEEDEDESIDREAGEKLSKLRAIFGLSKSEPMWATRCGLSKGLLVLYGQLFVSSRYIGFYRKKLANTTMHRFPIQDVRGAISSSNFHIAMKEFTLQIVGHSDMHFNFTTKVLRDEAIGRINSAIEQKSKNTPTSTPRPLENALDPNEDDIVSQASKTSESCNEYMRSVREEHNQSGKQIDPHRSKTLDSMWAPVVIPEGSMHSLTDKQYNYRAKIVNTPFIGSESRRSVDARHFIMLTIGSRGDIQPYIALSLGLMKHGHRCTIVTHDEFKEWIESYKIGYRQAGGDPAALMKLSVGHKMFSPGWFKESLGSYREWFDDLMHDAWVACEDADVLIESPSAMVGIHIAEALKIPYFRAFTMPWTRTHDVPHAFMTPAVELTPNLNYATYVLFDNIIWKATASPVNRWRKKELGLRSTNMELLEQRNVPFIYNFSSAVLPHPIDWKDNIMISGYWFLANSDAEWTAPDSLIAFMEQAREDGKPIVYIGFGSIVVPNPVEMTKNIIRAVEKSDVRAIVAKGWSSRGHELGGEKAPVDVPFPDSCYPIDKIPHDWLFPKIDACVHHGGAGTTGASLRWGRPTIIKPWFGDQFCWASQVTKLNVGARVTTLSGSDLTNALIKVTRDEAVIEAAGKIGERIRAENGVATAIEYLYSYLDRARDRHVSYKPEATRTLPGPKLTFPFSFSS